MPKNGNCIKIQISEEVPCQLSGSCFTKQNQSISFFHRNVCINFCATFLASGLQNSKVWSVNPRILLSLTFCIEYVYENNASSCNNNAAITRSLRRRTHSLVCFFGMVGRDFKKLKGCKKSPSNYIIFHYLSHKGPTIILIASCINAK